MGIFFPIFEDFESMSSQQPDLFSRVTGVDVAPEPASTAQYGVTNLEQRQQRAWHEVFAQVATLYRQEGGLQPLRRVLVLLPFAQLMPIAQKEWAAWASKTDALHTVLPPQFETTHNWAGMLVPIENEASDYRGDAAWDALNGQRLLVQAGLDASIAEKMLPLLLQACAELAPVVRAVQPQQRMQWLADTQSEALQGMEGAHVRYERLVASVAMVWLSSSRFTTDVLFEPDAVSPWDALVKVRGIQDDALADSVFGFFQDVFFQENGMVQGMEQGKTALECVFAYDCTPSDATVYAAENTAQEAEAATAAVLRKIEQGKMPVALVAQDRALTRRVRAALELRGVEIRDESGWRLSTTRAGALLVALLRAAPYQTSTVDVLDAMKAVLACLQHYQQAQAQAEAQAEAGTDGDGADVLHGLEQELQNIEELAHRKQLEKWPQLKKQLLLALPTKQNSAEQPQWVRMWDVLQGAFVRCSSLGDGLRALQEALIAIGVWNALQADTVGEQCLTALKLQPWQAGVLGEAEQLPLRVGGSVGAGGGGASIEPLRQWVQLQLEQTNFVPAYTVQAQATVLPLSQVLGRAFQSLVLAGADAEQLGLSATAQQFWSPAQREVFGLPNAEQQALQTTEAFAYALAVPEVALLYSQQHDGQEVIASPLVQRATMQYGWREAGRLQKADTLLYPHVLDGVLHGRDVSSPSMACAVPVGLSLERLSSSAYDSLRRCPYQFYARYLLRLHAVDEVDVQIEKQEYGVWLHTVLAEFHSQRKTSAKDDAEFDAELLDALARQYALDDARFLPYELTWQVFAANYLEWVQQQERMGWSFKAAEQFVEAMLGGVRLYGSVDRVDTQKEQYWLMDYKTTPREKSRRAAKDSLEYSQLVFYALVFCLQHDTKSHAMRTSYVNVSQNSIKAIDVQDLPETMAIFQRGLAQDIHSIQQHDAMHALGAATACGYCDYEGLCRKTHWAEAEEQA